jgi:hypothetical protein
MPGMILGATLGLLVLSSPAAYALEGPGSTGANYLSFPIGPTAIAMGGAQTALTIDPFSWLTNPGTLHARNRSGIGITHTEWINDARFDNISYLHRIQEMITLSGAFTFTYRPDIQGYDDAGLETKALKNNNYQAVIGIGISPLDAFAAGINIKYFQEKLDESKASGVAVDCGALYTFNRPHISLGLAVQNLGPDISFDSVKEPLPLTVRLGASHSFALVPDRYQFTYTIDLVKPRFDGIFGSAGAEIELYKLFAVRGGYTGEAYRPGDGLTMGAGFHPNERWRLDYAWTPYGDLGSFHWLALFLEL